MRAIVAAAPQMNAVSPPPRQQLLGLLARVTSGGRFVPQIDGLRFIAIFCVFAFHVEGYTHHRGLVPLDARSDWFVALAAQGHYGVQLFFLISGFVLALPFVRHHLAGGAPVGLSAYFLRRLTRLEPPYLVSMVLLYTLLVLVNGQSARALFPGFAASCAYLHNPIYMQPSRINGVAWSLEIEVQFYVLVPLLTRIFSIGSAPSRRLIIVVVMLAAAAGQRFFGVGIRAEHTILYFVQYFLSGFLLADVYVAEWNERPSQTYAWDVVGVLAGAGLTVVCLRDLEVRALFPFLSLAVAAAAFRGRVLSWLLRRPLLTTIGGMCYSIYLLHYQVISAVGRLTRKVVLAAPYWVNVTVQLAVLGAATVLVCGGFFVLIEKPCMRRDWPSRAMARLRWRPSP